MGMFEDIIKKRKKEDKYYSPNKVNTDTLTSATTKNRINELRNSQDETSQSLGVALNQREREREIYIGDYLRQNKLDGNIRNINKASNEFDKNYAEIKRKQQERYEKNYSNLNPGYELGDFTKGVLATTGDLGLDILEGGLNYLEGATDWATYRSADVLDFLNSLGLGTGIDTESMRKNADFASTATLFGKNTNLQQNILGDWTSGIEKASYSPEFVDQIAQGIGQIGMAGAAALVTGGSSLGTAAITYASSYGNARSEAIRNGATDEEARKAAIIHGVAETISEQIFAGIPGMKVEGWGSKLNGKISDAATKYFGSNAGKVALKVLDSAGEGTEEIISNILVAVGSDITHSLDNNYNYGMEGLTGNALEDIWDQVTSKDSWQQFFSAAISSAIVNGGKAIIDTKTQNKIINAYAKDNGMSFKDAKYVLTGQLDNNEQVLTEREKKEFDSQVELEEAAKQRVLNYMQSTQGQEIESRIQQEVAEREQQAGIQFTDEQRNQLTNDIRSKYVDIVNSPDYYTQFTQEAKTKKDKELVKLFQDANMDNTQNSHEIFDFIKNLQDNNKKAKFNLVTNQMLEQQGFNIKDENGNYKTINGFYKDGVIHLNKNAKNPYQQVVYHEIGHAIKESNAQLYDDMKKLVYELKGKEKLAEYRELYNVKEGEVASDLTDNVEDEYVNDMLGEILESDKFINTFQDNRTLLQKILDKLKELISSITSSEQKKHFKEIETKLQNLYKQGYEKAKFKGSEQAAFSLEYRGSHQIENAQDITKLNINDIQSKVVEANGYLSNQDQKDLAKLKKILNNPNEQVKVYRASPVNELNSGDWITTDKSYAQNIANNNGGKVYTYEVRANELYYPDNVSDLPSLHRLSSFQYNQQANTKYSLSVEQTNAQTDSLGRQLSDEQKEYFKDSKVVNEQGELIEVYHTMTDRGPQFNEFNPVKTAGYRFGDQVVTYYTDNQKMSGSYADGEYRTAYTSPINTINDVKDFLEFRNRETNDKLSANGISNNLEIKEDNGKYVLTQKPTGKDYLSMVKLSDEGNVALNRVKNNDNLHKVFLNSDNPANEIVKQLEAWYEDRNYEGYPELASVLNEYNKNVTKLIANANRYSEQSIIRTALKTDLEEYLFGTRHLGDQEFVKAFEKNLYKTFENEQDLINNIQSSFEDKYQYSGYVNITNPYIINTYGENWNSVVTERDTAKADEYNELIDTKEKKDALTKLAEESQKRYYDYVNGVNGLEYGRYKNIWGKITNRDLRDVIENTTLFGGDYNSWIEAGKRNAELFGETYEQDVPNGDELLSNYVKNLNSTEESLIKDMTLSQFVENYHNAYENESNYGNPESYFGKHYREITGKPLENIDTKNLWTMALDDFYTDTVDRYINKRYTTNDIVNKIIESNKKGETNYDGIIMTDVYDYGSSGDEFRTTGNLYVTFNSNQFKADTNKTPTSSQDIRFSLSQDSQGRELSTQQQEYFKDSKARDQNGNLEVLYHTTPNKFTIFDNSKLGNNTGYDNTSFGYFVTPNKTFSERFGNINEEYTESNQYKQDTYNFQKEVSNEQINSILNSDDGYEQFKQLNNGKLQEYADKHNINWRQLLWDTEFAKMPKVKKAKANTMELYANTKKPITHPYNAGYKYTGQELDNIVESYLTAINELEGLEGLKQDVIDGEYDSLYDAYMNIINTDLTSPFENAAQEKQLLEQKGYDAVEFVEGNESNVIEGGQGNNPVISYAVFDSNQLKNVDNTNPTENEDIRYSLGTETNLPTGFENTELFTTTEDYLRSIGRNLDYLQQISTTDDNLPFYTGEEETPKTIAERMSIIRQKLADDRFTKIMDKQTYKSIKDSTRMAKSYLDFDTNQTNEFKNQISKLAKLPKDKLIKAKNYNQLKDIISKYAKKDMTFVNQELKSAQKDVRNTQLIVSQELKDQITDWSDFRKRSGLNIRIGQKSNIDTTYQELLDTYPGMLDSTITNYADQLQELSEFVKRDNKYVEHYELNDDAITQITNKVWEKLSKNALTQQEINDIQADIQLKAERRTREVVREDLLDRMGLTLDDIAQGKDISALAYQRTDPNRLNEKVFGYEVGQKINQATAGFVKQQEAQKIRFLNKERDDIKQLGIKARSKESAAVQKYGEKQYVNSKGELVDYTEQDLMSEFKDEAKVQQIKRAAEVLRQKYDRYIDMINESLTEMGYDAIPKRQDYFKHFMELEDKLSQFGWVFSKENIMKEDLPTDINGLTDQFKPGKNYFASALQRKGLKTTYDAITGIDTYLEGASDLIFHTESIQRYRALSKLIRDTYGQQHGLEDLELMTPEEAQQRIQDVYDNKLTKYAAWLDEQANALAGKKAAIDRSVERFIGRRGYTLLNALKKQVGSNMTGFNVRSSLTNFASAIQGASKTEKLSALQGFAFALKNYRNIDPLVAKSDFLATRFGSDALSKKTWQKMSEAGQVFMNATDRFTSLQIWGGKYYEGLHHGLTEQAAIQQADDFASRIMGDRSKGQTAEIFNSKTLGFLTQFQLEVNNQWSSMIHDNKMVAKQNPGLKAGLHIANQLGQLYVASWVFNNLMKALTGTDVMIDPIDLLLGLFNPDDEDKTLEDRTTDMIGKIVNQLPMASIFTGGRIPISEAFKGVETGFKYATGQTDTYGNKYTLEDVKDDFIGSFAYYLLPTGYGQLRKTAQGLGMYANELPGSYTSSGRLRFEADTSPLGIVQSALFGQYASKEAREYFDEGLMPLTEKQISEAQAANLPIAEYREINEGIKAAKQEAKENGESQSEAQYEYIYNLPLSDSQKNTILNAKLGTSDTITDDNGYIKYTDGSKTYWYDKDNDTLYNSKYRKMDNIDVDDLEKVSSVKDIKDYGKYGSLAEFNYANNNPEKYTAITQITDYDTYQTYKDDISAIKENYNDGTTAGKKKAQQEVFNYINNLPLNKNQKLMLQKMAGGYSIKNYESQLHNYINSLDLTKEEKENIHKELF